MKQRSPNMSPNTRRFLLKVRINLKFPAKVRKRKDKKVFCFGNSLLKKKDK